MGVMIMVVMIMVVMIMVVVMGMRVVVAGEMVVLAPAPSPQQTGEHGKAGDRHGSPARRRGNSGGVLGVVDGDHDHRRVGMADVHAGEHEDVQRQQHGSAEEAGAGQSHCGSFNELANATLTGPDGASLRHRRRSQRSRRRTRRPWQQVTGWTDVHALVATRSGCERDRRVEHRMPGGRPNRDGT